MAKTGILLLNIGSPVSYEVADVKKYLLRFLMDKDIITAPYLVRWPLVHIGIVPRRAPQSAHNYKTVWMAEGSPLMVYTRRFAEKLQNELGSEYHVALGMRYSEPSIDSALLDFKAKGVSEIIAAPLYPQYAEATTGSSLKELQRVARKLKIDIPVKSIPPFYDSDMFIDPAVQIANETLAAKEVDHYLFSFHGLPKKQIQKVHDCYATEDCCFEVKATAKKCYRAHCYATATKMAERMGLKDGHWSVSFQSRLGPVEWIKPYTDHSLEALAKSGKKRVAILCPSFVADCIETLEEIGIGEKERFLSFGGTEYTMVPCVNDNALWVQRFAESLKKSF
ncbi:Ferrochelatase [compost metagenome]